jgi:hypothetical protein
MEEATAPMSRVSMAGVCDVANGVGKERESGVSA